MFKQFTRNLALNFQGFLPSKCLTYVDKPHPATPMFLSTKTAPVNETNNTLGIWVLRILKKNPIGMSSFLTYRDLTTYLSIIIAL